MINIGFQGTPHSYSESASLKLLEEYGIDDYKLIPLVSSETVASKLRTQDINYGVVAIQNTIGGVVKETDDAFISDEWIVKHRYLLRIEHCLFVKAPSIETKNIKKVSSHIQALKQCRNNLKTLINNYTEIEIADTALAAHQLELGLLDEQTAVICSKSAGLAKGLHLLVEGLQDQADNFTEFVLIEKKQIQKISFFSQAHLACKKLLFKDKFYDSFIKLLVSATLLLAFPIQIINNQFLPKEFSMSLPQAVMTSGALSLLLLSALGNYRRRNTFKALTGYWLYLDRVTSKTKDDSQNYAVPRAVMIDTVNDELRIRGWICTSPPHRYFEAKEIFHSDLSQPKGSLLYKYSNFIDGSEWNFNGIVELEWSKNINQFEIKNLFGRYFGFLSNTTGGLNFKRITKAQFYDYCPIQEE